MNNIYLQHHGILGQKWGVRRYQNYDGSYTKAGIQRYNKSLSRYEEAENNYNVGKKNRKDGLDVDVKKLKQDRDAAKKQLNKDYKHLKQDKLADQGKELYRNGKTITGNNAVTSIIQSMGGTALSAAVYNLRTGKVTEVLQKAGINVDNNTVTKTLAGIGAGVTVGTGVKKAVDYDRNKKLRAYYTHTSKY